MSLSLYIYIYVCIYVRRGSGGLDQGTRTFAALVGLLHLDTGLLLCLTCITASCLLPFLSVDHGMSLSPWFGCFSC